MNRFRMPILTVLVSAGMLISGCDTATDKTEGADMSTEPRTMPPPVRQAGMIASARYGVPIDREAVPDPIPKVAGADQRQSRNYPMQPPLIPHDIRGYEVNLQSNTCMACHARSEVRETQATMISVTHYLDREGNFLAEISPRRYFCTQCHVVQTASDNMVANNFVDMDDLIRERAAEQGN